MRFEVTYQVTLAMAGLDSARIIHTGKIEVEAANMAEARSMAADEVRDGPYFDRRIKRLGVRTHNVRLIQTHV